MYVACTYTYAHAEAQAQGIRRSSQGRRAYACVYVLQARCTTQLLRSHSRHPTNSRLTLPPKEQKRRQAIRDGFDKMASIVPGLEGQGRSEGHVLNVSVQFILEQVQERRRLVEQIEARGGVVSDELKAYVKHELACFLPPSPAFSPILLVPRCDASNS